MLYCGKIGSLGPRADILKLVTSLFGPQLRLEGSYKLGSLLLSFLPSFHQFSWNWLINFSVTSPSTRGAYGDVTYVRMAHVPQIWRKRAKNEVFRIYWKIWTLFFPESGLKWKFILLLHSCTNFVFGKNLVP